MMVAAVASTSTTRSVIADNATRSVDDHSNGGRSRTQVWCFRLSAWYLSVWYLSVWYL